MVDIPNGIKALEEEARQWRHVLHENPQTAFEETFASGFIREKLDQWGIPYQHGMAKTGVIATIEGQKTSSGKAVALRADMDALDITEKTNLPYQSKNPGKMHACGHDGHMAILLTAAKYLHDTKSFDGTVHLIFQPAEEGESGAHRMIEEGLFDLYDFDYIFGLHNWPDLAFGTIGTRPGPLMASIDEFTIDITGIGGHAAMPHLTVDPSIVASHLILALQSLVSRNVNPLDTAVVSICNVSIGTGALNIIGDKAILNGTVRAFSNTTQATLKDKIETMTRTICSSFGAHAALTYIPMLKATVNTKDTVGIAVKAAQDILSPQHVDDNTPPSMAGEDFGAFLEHKAGTFVFLGQSVADDPDSAFNKPLHSPYYDFNDALIPLGAAYFNRLVQNIMPL